MQQADGRERGATSLNICFSTTDSLLSRWIRWFTGAPVSHAIITYRCASLGKIMVMEASGTGFRMIPWARWERENTLKKRYRLVIEAGVQVSALRQIADLLGAEYDTVGLFGFVPRFLEKLRLMKRGRRLRNVLDDPRKVFCSEAVAMFLAHAGFEDFGAPGDWSPRDLFEWASRDERLLEVPIEENRPRTLDKMRSKLGAK